MTTYVVLGQTAPGGPWNEVERIPATSAEGAVRKVANSGEEFPVYVAVPERSWHPLTVEFEKTVQMKVTAAAEGAKAGAA